MSKNKHFKSEYHLSSECSFMRRYIIFNPDFIKIDEIMRIYVNFYDKKT